VIKFATAPNRVKLPARVEPAANSSQLWVFSGAIEDCSSNTAGTLEIKLERILTLAIDSVYALAGLGAVGVSATGILIWWNLTYGLKRKTVLNK
jgi:hypothetical protein